VRSCRDQNPDAVREVIKWRENEDYFPNYIARGRCDARAGNVRTNVRGLSEMRKKLITTTIRHPYFVFPYYRPFSASAPNRATPQGTTHLRVRTCHPNRLHLPNFPQLTTFDLDTVLVDWARGKLFDGKQVHRDLGLLASLIKTKTKDVIRGPRTCIRPAKRETSR
jgi:hypothetical protein